MYMWHADLQMFTYYMTHVQPFFRIHYMYVKYMHDCLVGQSVLASPKPLRWTTISLPAKV